MHVCDICKKPLANTYKLAIDGYGECGGFIPGSSKSYELCPDCKAKVNAFINSSSQEVVAKSTRGPITTEFISKVTAMGTAGLVPNTMVINCSSIKIANTELDLEIDVTDAMKNTDKVCVNGNEFVRKKADTITWRVIGYVGRSDYDGPSDDNLDFTLKLDKSITKDEVYAILRDRYKKYRNTVFKLYIVEE